MSEGKLGRRLSDLLGSKEPLEAASSEVLYGPKKGAEGQLREMAISLIDPNPYQPRTRFDREKLEELKQSIAASGVLQPIVVRPAGERFQVVVGERRLRAAREMGLERIPAVLRRVGDEELLELALIENIQRTDLNPVEKARAYRRLMQEFGLTQEQVAARVGQDRSTVANFVRLLELPKEVQDLVAQGTLSMGHARAIMGLTDTSAQRELARRIAQEGLSVRQAEKMVSSAPSLVRRRRRKEKSPQVKRLEDRLKRHLGTRVTIHEGKKHGRIAIEFYGPEDFDRLMEIMGLPRQE